MMTPSLAMAEPTMAISSTVAWGPAGLSRSGRVGSPTGSPAAAHASSHSFFCRSSAEGMSDSGVYSGKSMSLLKPKSSAPATSFSAPISTPSWPNTVFDESSVAWARVRLP